MAPFVAETATIPATVEEDPFPKLVAPQAAPRKYEPLYFNLVTFAYAHVAALYGIYLACTVASWPTLIFHNVMLVLAGMGITAAAHRLWSHQSYKAKLPLQIILMLLNSLAFQNTATHWARDHRMHHRYTDTDADPHNATRGFFYSHIGWVLVKKHPEVLRRGKYVDMSDIYANPVLRFQKKYAIPIIGTVCFGLPTIIPMYFFGEPLNTAWHLTVMRYVFILHMAFFVNSAGHLWGNKPYDKFIKSVNNYTVCFISFGECFHNYHHAFPWDYRTAELGNNWLNFTTKFIDFFGWIGWAYDRKEVPDEVVLARAKRTGDGTDLWGLQQDNSIKTE